MDPHHISLTIILDIIILGQSNTEIKERTKIHGIDPRIKSQWKIKYGGMLPSDMKWLKQLKEENAMIKKLVADLRLDTRCSIH